jgi:hypothetical protein|tara:strand:+ start:128 stop:811 length:684 start_codon:yes stop_codon:yes gene_type:complete
MSNYDHKFSSIYYPFGPYLYHAHLDQQFIKDLLEVGKKQTFDMRYNLAGKLKEEYKFEEEDQRWFNKCLKDVFQHYIQERMNFHGIKHIPDYIIENVWINHQYANDYQPEHIHSGDFSWVIYCALPEGLDKERQEHKTRGGEPGSIYFHYGENAGNAERSYQWVTTQHSASPRIGDMFIFPAQLRHMVPPFRCDGTRTSVSGNGSFQYDDGKAFHLGQSRLLPEVTE